MVGRFPHWVYLAVGGVIAVVAFGIGQARPGLGIVFALGASTVWAAYNANRARRIMKNG